MLRRFELRNGAVLLKKRTGSNSVFFRERSDLLLLYPVRAGDGMRSVRTKVFFFFYIFDSSACLSVAYGRRFF